MFPPYAYDFGIDTDFTGSGKSLAEDYTGKYHFFDTRLTAHAILHHQAVQGNEEAFVALLPHLMLHYPPGSINQHLKSIENQMDRFYPPIGRHPNTAELLLLLRHPKDPERKKMDQLTRTVTSINRFIGSTVYTLSDNLIKLWSDVGFYTHGFRFWKYDSLGGEDSLLARYGFKPHPKRETDKTYGKGFVLRGSPVLDKKTLVEFRRAYLLVSHPDHGTLLIRNSSPEYGRDKMPHPAMWSSRNLSEADLETYDPKKDNHCWSILEPRLYIKQRMEEKLAFLLGQLDGVKGSYQKWKFDSGRFENDKFLGHRSPGFKQLTNFLRRWVLMKSMDLEDRDPPVMAFVHPQYPPWEPYKFSNQQGKETATFELTPDHVTELAAYCDGLWDEKKLAKTDFYRFLQAGIANHGELVLLDPPSAKKAN
jgi:hypothetical protein